MKSAALCSILFVLGSCAYIDMISFLSQIDPKSLKGSFEQNTKTRQGALGVQRQLAKINLVNTF